MRQPDMIKVSWDQLDSNQSGGTQALSISVVPNKGIVGAEYSIICTIEEFKKKIKVCLDATATNYAQRLHNLFWQCLQGATATKWTAVLDQFPVAACTDTTFKEAQKAYLKKVAEVSNLGDMLIRQLCNNGKPAHMRFNPYVALCQEWVRHIDSGYLNITITRLTNQENVEAIFNYQPKCHQTKYVLEKEEVEHDLEKLQVFLVAATQLMKLVAPTLLSSRTSVTLSVLEARSNPVIQTVVLRAPTNTAIDNPMEAIVQ
eukprot:7734581-Ditylum_brightwellii.AAC.1